MRKSLPLIIILFLATAKVHGQCDATFTYSSNQAVVSFHALNTGTNIRHYWLFGDATNGSGANTTHTYSYNGAFTVTHIITDSVNQCGDTTQQLIGLNFGVPCQANFIVTRDSSNFYLYHFHVTQQLSNDIFYFWKIDGVLLSLPPSTVAFSQVLSPGNHTINLAIASMAGCDASADATIFVPIQCTLTASFTATPSSSNPRQISFIANPSSSTFLYDWSFGDGFSSLQQNPTHTYAQPGAYDVRLRVYDPTHMCFDTIIQNMVVHGLPSDSCTASFTYTAPDPSHPNQISFTAISNQTITSQEWWINHGTDSVLITANNPTHTFTDTGYYNVCLYITTSTGCTKWYCNGIYIDSIGGRVAGRVPSYPNPARSVVNFRLNLTGANRIGITVYNTSGYVVYQTQKQGNAGSNEINIPIEQLKSGQYFIDIQFGNERKRSIFQKL